MAHGITARDSLMVVRTSGMARPRRRARPHPAHPRRGAGRRRPDLVGGQGSRCTARDGRAVDGVHATVREDTDEVLGVVSDDYVVVQNRDCFAFLANLLGSELVFETAGSLWGGKQVFITAKLPDHITVGGDEVRPYVVLSRVAHRHGRHPRHDHARCARCATTPCASRSSAPARSTACATSATPPGSCTRRAPCSA